MVKKLKKMAAQKATAPAGMLEGLLEGLDSRLSGAVKASAQQIWLAGMGAFAKAQEEGGKVFEALVREGVNLQRKTQSVAEDRLGEVTGKMSAMAGEVTNKAGASWDKLEGIFESRTAKALAKLGVPNGQDLAELHAKVDALSAAVAKLGGKVEAPKKSAPKRPTTQKAASARPAAKKPVKAAAAPAKKSVKPAAAGTVAKSAAKAAARRAPAKKSAQATGAAAATGATAAAATTAA